MKTGRCVYCWRRRPLRKVVRLGGRMTVCVAPTKCLNMYEVRVSKEIAASNPAKGTWRDVLARHRRVMQGEL